MVSFSTQSLDVCQGRSLGAIQDHMHLIADGMLSNHGDVELACLECNYPFENDYCYQSHKINKLSGSMKNYCSF